MCCVTCHSALQHLLHHGWCGEGGRLRSGDGHGPGGGRRWADRPDAGPTPDPTHGSGRHQTLYEPWAGEQVLILNVDFHYEYFLTFPTLFVLVFLLAALWELILPQSGHLLSGSDPVWAAVSLQDTDGESEGESAVPTEFSFKFDVSAWVMQPDVDLTLALMVMSVRLDQRCLVVYAAVNWKINAV